VHGTNAIMMRELALYIFSFMVYLSTLSAIQVTYSVEY